MLTVSSISTDVYRLTLTKTNKNKHKRLTNNRPNLTIVLVKLRNVNIFQCLMTLCRQKIIVEVTRFCVSGSLRVPLNAQQNKRCCPSWETIYNVFYQKHLIKPFHFLFTVCFIHNLLSIHPALCLLGNQFIPAPIEFSYLYLSCSICPFSLSFWAGPDNSESVT